MGKFEKKNKKKFPWLLIPVVLALAVVCAVAAVRTGNVFFRGERIDRGSREADLRHLEMTVEEFEALSAQLPDCHILWEIPIGGSFYDCTSQEIRLDTVSDADIPLFAYFDDLRRIDARNAHCYPQLLALQQALPECSVEWALHLGSGAFSPDTKVLQLETTGATAEELLACLPLFTHLERVEMTDVTLSSEQRRQLLAEFPEITFRWSVPVPNGTVSNDITELDLSGTVVDLQQLLEAAEFLPDVEVVNLRDCGLSVQDLLAVQKAFGAAVSSELSLYGVDFDTDTTHLYFNGIPMESVDAVETILPLLPRLEWVEMCGCGISSEEMDALWKRHPQTRFVWEVKIGRATLRTDCTNFIGAKHGYLANASIADPYKDKHNRLFDEDCVEFKYCVDMVCLDLGHMGITDYSFLEYMPKLRYLILADTHGTDFSSLANLKELVFLEVFLTDFQQPEVLLGLTKLEDLNIAYTLVDDPQALTQMTWLKRLWVSYSKMSFDEKIALAQALPDTQVDYTAEHSTANGWRTGYLYYEMRDYLGMYYLE